MRSRMTRYMQRISLEGGRAGPAIIRRVRPKPGSQFALFTDYDYHPLRTDRAGDALELEADHGRHAEVEHAIRDPRYGVGLNHLPSGVPAATSSVQW